MGAQQLGIDIIRDIEISMGQARDLTQQIITFTRENKPEFKSASVGDLAREWATFVLRGSIAEVLPRLFAGALAAGRL